MGCHPADEGTHDFSLYCNDIRRTVAELMARGVEFVGPIVDQGFSLVTHFRASGGLEIQLYQAKYRKGP